jgi:TonB family protein
MATIAPRLLLFFVAAAATVHGQGQPPRITPEDARFHVGQFATVCGPVVRVTCADGGMTLGLAARHGDDRLRIRFPSVDANALAARSDRIAGYNVCGTGIISQTPSGHEIVVNDAAASETLNAALAGDAAGFGAGARSACDPAVTLPTLRRSVRPDYPSGPGNEIRGNVFLQLVVLADGTVGDIKVVSGLHPDLDKSSVAAMRRFQFNPGSVDNIPAAVVISGEMAFTGR